MITVTDLSFAHGSQRVLDNISLTVQRSEILSVMGPSGCGKSTFLKCVAGLLRPDHGSIVFDPGHGEEPFDITQFGEYELNEYRRRIGMVFQYAALFDSMTVRDNVAFPLYRFHPEKAEAEVTAEVEHLLELVGLDPALTARKMPAQLSGGMRKRVGLARALALQPTLMLYDEPSSGLDPVSAANIDHLILQMRDHTGATSILVSHHVQNILNTSDRIAMLYGGKVLALGTPDDILASDDPRVQQFITGSVNGPLTDVEV